MYGNFFEKKNSNALQKIHYSSFQQCYDINSSRASFGSAKSSGRHFCINLFKYVPGFAEKKFHKLE